MIWPMWGEDEIRRGAWLVVERLYWRGRPLPLGWARLRWLTSASEQGYGYPGKPLRLERELPDHRRRAA